MPSAGHGALFIVSAPSGGGKTSLTRALVPHLAQLGIRTAISVSATTRAPRPGEQDGVHYHFRSTDDFERMVRAGEFLEHAQVFGNRYGTCRAITEAQLAAGIDVILDIDWQGARQVKAEVAGAVGIFILPPSAQELERRLRGRAQDDEAVIARRMAQARAEMSHWDEYEHIVVNREFERALGDLAAIFRARRLGRACAAAEVHGLLADLLGA